MSRSAPPLPVLSGPPTPAPTGSRTARHDGPLPSVSHRGTGPAAEKGRQPVTPTAAQDAQQNLSGFSGEGLCRSAAPHFHQRGRQTYQALQGGEHRAVPRHFPQVLKDGATGLLVQQRERTQLQVGTFCRRYKNNDRSHQRRRESRESVGSVSGSDSNHLSGSFS